MKKLLFALFIIMMMSGTTFANKDADVGNFSPGAIANTGNNNTIYGAGGGPVTNQGGTGVGVGVGIGIGGAGGDGGSVTINKDAIKNTNTNTNLNLNTNINDVDNKNVNINRNTNIGINDQKQGQSQGQGQQQGQDQGQGQGQSQSTENSNNAKQTVLFKSPTPLLGSPSQNVPELNFGNGRMIDATSTLPNFAIYGIRKLGSEMIIAVLNVNANVKFKNLYQGVLDDAAKIANGGRKTLTDVRYQIIRAEAQKSWTTGGNLGGAGSVLSTSGLSGGSGAGSIVPQWGGTKADDLFTIIFVKIGN